jgi:transcriptional regulator with XRE-family HTH domain
MTFVEMLAAVRENHSQKAVARGLRYSVQYISDLERGRRAPSVEVVDRICEWMGRGPKGRREWHLAGARAQGWEV